MKTFDCLYCNKTNPKSNQTMNKYCSNSCQGAHKRQASSSLVESGKGSPRLVKLYLLEKLGNVCQDTECAWDSTKRPVSVELEHIDGNSENNTLSNCTLLCPNCHSLTPTYKAKNKGNGRHNRKQRYADGKSF